ncbi:hypothetical protein FGO68_gene14324 [Halteria grandinella]|uniref:Uncharacterized protein n=1 Tax=Halteria grandinella TaxID=5974 RepID=A0A8J8NXL1_HALGN|nr:hypothetical protein FGO68_gene14324 [Halteria grandinella]
MEPIFTGAKYRLGKIINKYIIIQILVDNLDKQSALLYLAKTSRIFRSILKQAPSMIQRRLLKAIKAITTCPEYNKFCLQQWTQGIPEAPQFSNQSISSLFQFSESQINVTAKSIEQLRMLADLTQQKGYSRVKCLTIITDDDFTWKDEEFRRLVKIISPKEQNIGMKKLTFQLQHPIDFNEAVPPSVEILRLSVKFLWSPQHQNDSTTEALKVNYLCITIQEVYELRFILKKIQPQVMLIIDLSRCFDKTFFDRIIKEKVLDGFQTEVLFSIAGTLEITESILSRFEKIKVAKKYLLCKKFNLKSVGSKYIELHKERLVELFKENKSFRRFMGNEFSSFKLQWFARERQLRQNMKIPIPHKSLLFEYLDNLYPDYFFANVMPRNLSAARITMAKYKELLDSDIDTHTMYLEINLYEDSRQSLKYLLKYFIRKCTNLERLTLNLKDMISRDSAPIRDNFIDVCGMIGTKVQKLKKLEINHNEHKYSQQNNNGFSDEIMILHLQQIVEDAKQSLHTLVLNISLNKIDNSEIYQLIKVNKSLLSIFTPQDNKMKKLTLMAHSIDEEICRILLDEINFPHLKSLALICNEIVADDPCLPYLFALTARPLQKLRFLRCPEFDSSKELFMEQILSQLSPAIKLLQIEEASLSLDDCVRILSSQQRTKGFTFRLDNNRVQISDEEVEQLSQTFPEYCILIHCIVKKV